MLDVYRNYYGLTGEPFRLGPDHRFSLHHESYANAKAYLEYAIYQGEGFIVITGEPGTGKTTLINEILAGLDHEKVLVATLNSTQLEPRDLLHMVASSFELYPEDTSKAKLLVEIESFLVRKIRGGQRAILIVDEAQDLSSCTLEELRLLANLQYKHQLLLQIFLVGQEQLLELVRAPGMEHLHQRLVAATTLEPLSFDETIDYIEHRLNRVGWSGTPAIDEGALTEIYRYSGGIPRRINLIANRLFLYGGMEEKQRFDADDSRNVIRGLIEECLLHPEPLIAETDIVAAADAGGKERSRSLPRDGKPSAGAPPSPANGGTGKAEAPSGPGADKRHSTAPEPTGTAAADRKGASAPPPADRAAPPPSSGSGPGPGPAAPRPAPPAARKSADKMERPVPPRPTPGSSPGADKKGGGKGVTVAVLLLAGAGAAYLLREQPHDPDQIHEPLGQTAAPVTALPELEPDTGPVEATAAAPTENLLDDIAADPAAEAEPDHQTLVETSEQGRIMRSPPPEPVDSAVTPRAPAAAETPPTEKETPAPAVPAGPPVSTPPAAAADEAPAPVQAEPAPTPAGQAVKPDSTDKETRVATVEKAGGEARPTASTGPPRTDEHLAQADAAPARPDTEAIAAQLARLRQAAEQRFSDRQARLPPRAGPVTAKPEEPAVAGPVGKTPPTVADTPAAVKKKRRTTPDEIASRLLDGRWSSRGKPASLLPSETTSCDRQTDTIVCLSTPRNVNTRYGLALYKVETTLSGFSAQGHFEMSYRTLVRLVDSETAERNGAGAASDDNGWQITEYSMSCRLTEADRVSCLDGKGVSREYRKSGPATGTE